MQAVAVREYIDKILLFRGVICILDKRVKQ